jgi:hypothetical protein
MACGCTIAWTIEIEGPASARCVAEVIGLHYS